MIVRDTLLLVDHAAGRADLRNAFEETFNILEAENGERAMLLLSQYFDRIAAVILNETIAIGDRQLLQSLQEQSVTTQLPVVVVLDSRETDFEERALDYGAADVLSRPFSHLIVKKRIENLIALYHGEAAVSSVASNVQPIHSKVLPDNMHRQLTELFCTADPAELDLEVYRIIMEQSGDVAFLWDMESDVLQCSPKWKERFGYAPVHQKASSGLLMSAHFHPDDLTLLEEKIENLRCGTEYDEIKVRIVNRDGRYSWNQIRAIAQRNTEGKLQKLVGVVSDVDSDHRAFHALMKQAERDSLTGLLNTEAARHQIERYLERIDREQKAALLIIDLDDFKEVNDRYGHMFGDAVLTRVAAAIRGLFRGKDVLARIGGDEFMVFMTDIPNGKLVERRCNMLLETLQGIFDERFGNRPFGCSVGFTLVPDHGTVYQTLFQRADRALYQAKDLGKKTYRCYKPSDDAVSYRTKVNRRIDSDDQDRINIGSYANFALELIREANDTDGAIRLLMEMIGTQMNVSRMYLYEKTADQTTCVNRFEWHAEGVTPVSSLFPDICGEHLKQLEDAFRVQEVIYASSVSDLPENLRKFSKEDGSNAVLLRALWRKDKFCGFIGVDDCRENRLWTRDEIEILTFLSHLISLWLLREKE